MLSRHFAAEMYYAYAWYGHNTGLALPCTSLEK